MVPAVFLNIPIKTGPSQLNVCCLPYSCGKEAEDKLNTKNKALRKVCHVWFSKAHDSKEPWRI